MLEPKVGDYVEFTYNHSEFGALEFSGNIIFIDKDDDYLVKSNEGLQGLTPNYDTVNKDIDTKNTIWLLLNGFGSRDFKNVKINPRIRDNSLARAFYKDKIRKIEDGWIYVQGK